MADPFSIAGSAVGVVSLGITVCQGLHRYYSACRDGPSDVKALVGSLDGLICALQLLEGTINDKDFNSAARADIAPFLADCADAVQNLAHELDKVKRDLPAATGGRQSVKGKLSSAGKTLLYPFRESTLKKLLGFVGEVRENLHTATSSELQKIDDVKAAITQLAVTTADVKQGVDTLVTAENEKIFRWLAAADSASNHEAARKKWQPDTGLWLTGNSDYIRWRDETSPMLWLYGIPGCGKTIMCSTVIENVIGHRPTGAAIAYFYFDFRDSAKQTLAQVLRSLLVQLCSQSTVAFRELEELYKHHDKGRQAPSSREMDKALLRVLTALPQAYVILDALDECPEREELLDFLRAVAERKSDQLHLLVTSRPLPDIKEALDCVDARRIALRNDLVDHDIKTYVRARILADKALQWPSDVQDEIEKRLTEGAAGMFRWAFCQLDALRKCRTTNQVRATMRSLPTTLDETYDRILAGIGEHDCEYALRALQWVAFAARPVSLDEVAEALVVDLDRELPHVNGDRALRDAHVLVDICASLVSLSQRDEAGAARVASANLDDDQVDEDAPETVLQLAHYSVKEYLVSPRIRGGSAAGYSLQEGPMHAAIAECCLAYLLVDGVGVYKALSAYPLACYAAQYWPYHARNASEDCAKISQLGARLLSQESYSFDNWLRLYDMDARKGRGYPRMYTIRWEPLYYMAFCGVRCLVRTMIDSGADVNARGGFYGTALQAALNGGHCEVVQLLLDNGARVLAPGGEYDSALQAASIGGHDDVVQLLLSNGAHINASGGKHGSALQAASVGGHVKIVKLLLSKGAHVNAPEGGNGSPLEAASANGHLDVVQLLLDKGADVDVKQGRHGSALLAALAAGHRDVIHLLLDKGADAAVTEETYVKALGSASREGFFEIVQLLLSKGAEAHGRCFGSALQEASAGGHREVAQLLLKNGADVNAHDRYLGSPLQAASEGGHFKLVQQLLDEGADVNAQKGDLCSALQAAAMGGRMEMVQLLLNAGADANAQGGRYGFALQIASRGGNREIVNQLLHYGAHVNARGGEYSSALQAVSASGDLEIVRILLNKGADADAQGGLYGSALRAASTHGHLEVARLLLDGGADPNAPEEGYDSALQKASHQGSLQIVSLLLEKGADVNAQGRDGSAIQGASYRGHREIVQLQLDNGADVNAPAGWYGSALRAAAAGENLEILSLLLSKGADVNAPGGRKGSALQVASATGNLEIVKLLLYKGACANTSGGDYGSPLQEAAARGDLNMVRLLLDNGARDTAQNGHRRSALQLALNGSHFQVLQLLLDKGDNSDEQAKICGDVLLAASLRGSFKAVQQLLNHGAYVDAQNNRHGSALQAASLRGHFRTVHLLLDKGADVNAQGGEYGSALQAASASGCLKIVRLLLNQGADANAQGGERGSALQLAVEKGHHEVAQLFMERGANASTQDEEDCSVAITAAEEQDVC